jgi:lipoprotein Spr
MRLYTLYLLIAPFLLASCGAPRKVAEGSGDAAGRQLLGKYSSLLGVEEKQISDVRLYRFIDEWYGTPYKYAGKTKSGVDCSGFSSALYREVYGKNISGSASGIYEQCRVISQGKLHEGDLVFFKIESGKVSHVGVYLQNNKFVHASTKKGVVISDLDEPYYKKYFYKGGRLM